MACWKLKGNVGLERVILGVGLSAPCPVFSGPRPPSTFLVPPKLACRAVDQIRLALRAEADLAPAGRCAEVSSGQSSYSLSTTDLARGDRDQKR